VPVPLPIVLGNVTLPNNHSARGLQLTVGTPPQAMAFAPEL
jgi:hypothetical protein